MFRAATAVPSNSGSSARNSPYSVSSTGVGRWGVTVSKQLQHPGYPVVSFYSYDSFYGSNAIPCDNVERTVILNVPQISGRDLEAGETANLYVQIRPANEAGKSLTTPVTVRG
jgi:hypothetical protein